MCIQIEKQETEHVRQLQDLEVNLSDKDTHISSLLKQIRNLQGNGLPMQPVPHPPGAAHRTMSVGVQTSSEIVSTSNNSVLQLCQMQPVTALGEGSALADTREGNDNTTIEDGPTNINVDPLSAGVEVCSLLTDVCLRMVPGKYVLLLQLDINSFLTMFASELTHDNCFSLLFTNHYLLATMPTMSKASLYTFEDATD